MQKMTLDPVLQAQLTGLQSEVEVCDEAGQTLGYFVTADWHRQLLYAWAKTQVTDEELAAARREPGGRSLAAILADLEKSGCATG